MDELRKKYGGGVYGRDIKAAFNSLDRDMMYEILKEHQDLRDWVNYFLRPRTFNIRADGKVIGRTTMVRGTPQDSPVSPTLLTIYMSAVVKCAEEELGKREEVRGAGARLRSQGRERAGRVFIPLSYIGDVNSIRVGKWVPWMRA